ncbi:MAG: HAD family hydrolase [Bdellovibrionota bacterium]
MAHTSKPMKAVLLDVDGTLIDSNAAHARTWGDAFREFGIDADLMQIRSLVGMGGDHIVPKVSGFDDDSGLGKKITARKDQLFETDHLPKLKAFRFTRDLLQEFKKRGLKLVVATSSGRKMLDKLLAQAGIADLIDIKASADDAENSKPCPDIIMAALQKAELVPSEAVMIGDTPYDVVAATNANVRIIAFLCGGWTPADLKGAAAIFSDPADLLAHLKPRSLNQTNTRCVDVFDFN